MTRPYRSGPSGPSRGAFSLTATGSVAFSAPLLIRSNGVDALTTSLTFAGIAGTPSVDFSSTLELLALL